MNKSLIKSKNIFASAMKEYEAQKKQQGSLELSGVFEEVFKQEGNEWTHGIGKNQVVNGEVVNIDEKLNKVEIRTGLKSNSLIPFKEFKINDEQILPKVGDTISVIVEGIDSNGVVFVCYKKVKFEERMREIEQIYVNRQSAENNKTLDTSLLKLTVEGTVLYKSKATVSNNFKNNSYVVDLGYGVLALAIPDNFSELEPNKKVTAFVNRFDTKKFGIILGIKRESSENLNSEAHKNYENQENVEEGQILDLVVGEHKDFGVLCSKAKEEEGENKGNIYFVSSTELTFNKRIRKKSQIIELFPIGKSLKAIGLGIKDSSGKKKIILSSRELYPDLITKFLEFVKEKTKEKNPFPLNGTIVEKRESELIVKMDFEGNVIEGKLSREDLSWNAGKAINKFRTINPGDKIEVAVILDDPQINSLDGAYQFIPLSVKTLEVDPFQAVLNSIKVGQVYQCMFVGYNNEYGASMSLKLENQTWTPYQDIDILIQNRELKELPRDINTKQGATNYAKVIRIDTQHRFIYISIKSAEVDDIAKYSQANQEQSQVTLNLKSLKIN